MKKPVVLCIMDGYGKNDSDYGNAIAMAKKPNLDKLMAEYPMTYIGASGLDVGLPDGQMGNSEVGHTNIGAGRVVYQPLTRITKAFEDGDAEKNPALKGAMDNAKGKALHLIGLVSPGGVHSHSEHLYHLLQMAKNNGRKHKFIRKVLTVLVNSFIRSLNRLNCIVSLNALAINDSGISLFNSVPNIVTVHSVKSAHYGSDFTYADFLHFILKFIEIFNG